MNSIADINPSIAESVEQAEAIRTSMQVKLDEMRRAYHQAPSPSLAERKHDLKQLKRLIGDNTESISQAISRDYGHRSEHETMFAEFIGTGGSIDDILKNLKSWMKPEKRHIDATMFPFASNTVIPQPLGPLRCVFRDSNRRGSARPFRPRCPRCGAVRARAAFGA